jgi:hypothetical protein
MVRIFYTTRQPEAAQAAARVAYKVNADGGDVAFGVGVVGETKQQARFPHARVTDEQELEQVIVSEIGISFCLASWLGGSL